MEAPIFCEAGVMYCVPEPHHKIPPYMNPVEYNWQRKTESLYIVGSRIVYLFNPQDIHMLLSHWNRQDDWKYWTE